MIQFGCDDVIPPNVRCRDLIESTLNLRRVRLEVASRFEAAPRWFVPGPCRDR